MPTYVYRRADGTLFEAFQKMSDPPLTEDPETGEPVTRQISGGAGLQFKGSGFYLTDYGKSGSDSKTAAAAETKAAGGGTGSSDTPSSSSESSASSTASSSSTGSASDD